VEASASQRVTAAEVQFSSILARNLDGELIPVTLDLPVTVDVFDLLDGGEYELPAGLLPPGDYDQIVVVMTALSLTVESGTRITIEPPGGGWTAIIATGPFSVVDGATTTIRLDLRWHDAIEWLGDHFEFHPIFDCDVDDPSGGGDDDSSGNGQGNGQGNGNRRG
jgi:hypothetical protein